MRFRFHHRRLSAALAAVGLATAIGALPGVAHAASVTYSKGTIKFAAAKGEANHVVVQPIGYALVVSDSGARSVKVGTGCYQASSSAAACPLNAANLSADLGDGNDFFDASLAAVPVNVTGGAGNDTLHGGTGVDTLDGGSEDDSIDARDSVADSVVCGTGADGGYADDLDTTSADCESVQRPSPPPETVAPPKPDPVVDPTVDPVPDPGTTDPGTTDPGTTDP